MTNRFPPAALRSLRGRIFLASALLAVLSIGVAIYLVNVRVTREAEGRLQREIVMTAAVVDELRTSRTQTFAQMARFVADAPKVKAAVDTNDPPTVQDVANGYREQLGSSVLLVTSKTGRVLASLGASTRSVASMADQATVRAALEGREAFGLLLQPDGILQVVSEPITIGLTSPEILGTLSVGFLIDNALAAQLKTITGSDVAFGVDGRVFASTLPRDSDAEIAPLLRSSETTSREPQAMRALIAGDEYLALPRPALNGPPSGGLHGSASGLVAVILRSRTEELRSLQAIRAGLAATAVVAVILAILLSFAVTRTITRPLAAITDAMREVARTGDLTRRIPIRRARWEDEDARLLATTFNTLTESIARFQREASQRERLSSLGRLSTVIAHEIRNPLMIIKASLHTLRRSDADAAAVREAASDIDEEVVRLNRLVNEVLDFSRPIRFELSTIDLAGLCRESATASQVTPGLPVELDLEPGLPPITTDAERLRLALVNILVNARHASNGNEGVRLSARATRDSVQMTIADRGVGISQADLPRIFDPYFTTKRGGTGLGLPIAKNIIEGLGGSITAVSAVGEGTTFRIELPIVADCRLKPEAARI